MIPSHEEEKTSSMGVFGPVYALHKVDDEILPEPIELAHEHYSKSDEVLASWNKLAEQYSITKLLREKLK